MITTVTKLDRPPISGSVAEVQFDVRGDCTWVLFDPPDAEPWAGVFGNGDVVHCRAACVFGDGRSAFVIAGGQGYVIDLRQKELIHRTSCDYLQGVIAPPYRDFVVAADFNSLLAYDRQGTRWHIDYVALDGIILDKATPTLLSGKTWQVDGWYSFELEFEGWHFVHGKLLSPDWFSFKGASA